MKTKIFSFLFFSIFISYSQINNFKLNYNLDDSLNETSGLIFYNSKIITHNDSGNNPKLYELDSITGNLIRTVTINNATNIDWEDISQDNEHIYIGDIGNNSGNRKDLKIYKIKKQDYSNNNSVSSEVILFSYKDQTDFSVRVNNHNFDSEAISIVNDKIVLFTKNWENLKTNVYEIPKTAGEYDVPKLKTYNTNCLITGSTYDIKNNYFLLTGYDRLLNPSLIFLDCNSLEKTIKKIDLKNLIGQGSQIEAIGSYDNEKYYITREKTSTTINNNTITIPSSLFSFNFIFCEISTIKNCNTLNKKTIYPNPTNDFIYLNFNDSIKKITVFNTLGKELVSFPFPNKKINISSLNNGIYILHIHFLDKRKSVKKVIKI